MKRRGEAQTNTDNTAYAGNSAGGRRRALRDDTHHGRGRGAAAASVLGERRQTGRTAGARQRRVVKRVNSVIDLRFEALFEANAALLLCSGLHLPVACRG